MFPRMIEVHTTGYPISVNIDHIAMIGEEVIQMDCITDDYDKRTFYEVDESYEDLKALIHGAGCLIHKADPRLENKRLTMNDLKEMIGEPVWNSNNGQWYLVHSCYRNKIFLTTKMGTHWEFPADDLEKYPLYRMKVQNDPISD